MCIELIACSHRVAASGLVFTCLLLSACTTVFLVLGDMSAALIGISFGRIKIGKKSLEGTLAMFTTCYLIGAVMFWLSLIHI